MPFLAPVAAAVGAGLGAVASVAAPVVGTIGSALGSVGSFIGSAAGAIGSAVSGTVGTVLSGIGGIASTIKATTGSSVGEIVGGATSTIGDIIGGIKDFVEPLISTISDVIQPVKTLADNVAGFARSIQDGLIAPIITPIEATVSNVENLTKEIHIFTSQGIEGILKIPGAVADAFSNTAAAFDRSFQQLGEAQSKIVDEQLIPGLTKAVAPGLGTISDTLLKSAAGKDLSIDQLKAVSLPVGPGRDALRKIIQEFYDAINKPEHWYESLVGLAFHGAAALVSILASLTPEIEDAVAIGKAANPLTKFDAGTVTRMLIKGIVDQGTWHSEMLFAGYDTNHQAALLEDAAFLPEPNTAISWWLRKLISDAELSKVLKAQGSNSDDVEAFKSASQQLLPAQTLLDLLARGIISQETFVSHLEGQGYTAETIATLIKGGISTPNPQYAIAALPNALAAAANWFAETYGSAPSDEVINASKAARLDLDDMRRLWEAHWQAMPVQTAINLFFRGQMNRDEVKIVVAQNNLPPNMTDLLIESQSDLLQMRTIPSLLMQGILSESEALHKLKQRGFSDADALILVESAKVKAQAKAKPALPKTVELSAGAADTAYRDGVLTEQQYIELLGKHGFSNNDVKTIVAVANFHIEHSRKADISATLKAEIALGTITLTDAVAKLHQDHFSNTEIERFQNSIKRTKKVAAKLPSEANIIKMHKGGLLDDAGLLSALDLLGYASPWDQLMFKLITGADFQEQGNGQKA